MISVSILIVYAAFVGIMFGEEVVRIDPPGSLTGGSEQVDFGEFEGEGFFAKLANAAVSVFESIIGVAADAIDALFVVLSIVFDVIPLFVDLLTVDLPIEIPVFARILLTVVLNILTLHVVWSLISLVRGS